MIGQEIFISSVLIAGFISFFSPCTFPLLPVYIGVITGKSDELRKKDKWKLVAIGRTMIFVLGFSTIFIVLGFGAGFLGKFINGRAFSIVSGIIVVLLGLHQMELFRIKFLEKSKTMKIQRTNKHDLLGIYLLGLTFSFAWTPCVGPVLGAILVVSSGGGQALYGVILMMIYTLGLAIPFLIMAVLSELLMDKFIKVEKHLGTIKKVGGAIIVIMGLLLMTENLNMFTSFFERLF